MVLLFVLSDNHLGNYLLLQKMKKGEQVLLWEKQNWTFYTGQHVLARSMFSFFNIIYIDNLNELK